MMEANELLGKKVVRRDEPNVYGRWMGQLLPYASVEYVEIVPDAKHPRDSKYLWLALTDGSYVNYVHPPVSGPRFDLAARYGWLMHDDQLFGGRSRPEVNKSPARTWGLPETIPNVNKSGKWVSLEFEIQWFMFFILKRCAPTLTDAEVGGYFASYTHSSKAMTNHSNGSNVLHDFVNERNEDGEPIRLQPMTFGGGFHRLVGKPYKKWGKLNQNVRTIDPLWLINQIRQIADEDARAIPYWRQLISAAEAFAEVFNPETQRTMFIVPSNSTRKVLPGNRRQVDPFPMRDKRLDIDYVPFLPYLAYGGVDAIDARRVVEQTDPTPPNPFYPPR